jgi:hypothetical protein
MTTYYISPNGSDSNNGLGPDASHATNKPWLTLAKALHSGTPVVAGDTAYVAPGTYWSTGSVTPVAGTASVVSPTAIVGDPTNAQGFKDGSGVRLASGVCRLTRRSVGEGADGTGVTTSQLLVMNEVHGLQWKHLVLEDYNTSGTVGLIAPTWTTTDWLFEDCRLVSNIMMAFPGGTPTAGMNLTFRRCTIIAYRHCFRSNNNPGDAATADADMNVLIEGCLIIGSLTAAFNLGSSGGNKAGGWRIKGNTFLTGEPACISTASTRVSTVTPVRVEGNIFVGSVPVSATTAGQVVDDGYNRFYASAGSTNFTVAGTSILGPQFLLALPDLVKWGLEMPRADWFGWTDQAAATQIDSAWSNTNADWRGRTVRPWGAGTGIGYVEAPSAAQDTASAITGGGANSLKMTAAGEVSFYLPVEASSTTISVKTKSDSYGGTSYPQLIVQPNPSIGVAGTTVTATDATEQTLTTGAFTPTAQGVVEVRLVSRSSATNSSTWFDLLTVTP